MLLEPAVQRYQAAPNTEPGRTSSQVSTGFDLHLSDAGARVSATGQAERRGDRPTATYRIVTNNFLSDGGDGFPAFRDGTGKYFGGLDIDAFANYLHGALAVHAPSADDPHHRRY